MARVTVEDCLARVPNRFALTILASRRARALSEGHGQALVDCDNKDAVTALREISDDRVRYREDVDGEMREFIAEQRRQLQVSHGEHTFLEAASLRAFEDEAVDEVPDEVAEVPTDPEALNKAAAEAATEDSEEAEEESSEMSEDAGFEESLDASESSESSEGEDSGSEESSED